MLRERLDVIIEKLKNRQVVYKIYNPKADYMFDIEDADEDMAWLVYEVARLRKKLGYPEGDASENKV